MSFESTPQQQNEEAIASASRQCHNNTRVCTYYFSFALSLLWQTESSKSDGNKQREQVQPAKRTRAVKGRKEKNTKYQNQIDITAHNHNNNDNNIMYSILKPIKIYTQRAHAKLRPNIPMESEWKRECKSTTVENE